ncbi:MAG: hypothetical protein PHO37_15675 [Kiritimatiellae bacterium]|nr:hypothetical protein [Kiritimatiellia bacterium]
MKTDETKHYTAVLLVGSSLIMGSLHAKTIALWKLDTAPTDTAFNTRCLINPANDLTINGVAANGGAAGEWSLPPNPDTTENMLDNPSNKNSIFLSPNNSNPRTCLSSSTFGAKLNITNSFTVEGWIKRMTNPGTWQYVVGAHNGGAGRWFLSLRNAGNDWIMYADPQIWDTAFPVKNDPSSTNVWRHIALSYDHNAGSAQQGVWELFVDSQSYGTLTNASRTITLTTSDNIFYLGGRANALNMADESLDYWRVSDTPLATNEFLNAGTPAPETEVIPRTIAYWRLDSDTNGTMNTADYIDDANLYSNLDTPNYPTAIEPATIQAFTGQPPNSTITLPDGNAGSAYAQGVGAILQTPNLGTHLEITNNFTVEGWLCPHRRDYDTTVQYIANTRINAKGWAFALKILSDKSRRLVIFAEDDTGVLIFDQPISDDLSDWSAWKHVALVYDSAAGTLAQGVWSCYLDGELQGCATNSRVIAGSSSSEYFHLGGRVNHHYTFAGYMDCWRAAKVALTPNQFLNATNSPAAATDVLALWPLNCENGVHMDATDIVGAYNFNVPVSSTYKVTANPDHAVADIYNPDATETFQGDPSVSQGSIVFNTPANAAPRASLSTVNPSLRSALDLANSFTFEGWFNRAQNPGAWQILFATASASPSTTGTGMRINFTHRTNGYVLYVDSGARLINDVAFAGNTDNGATGLWRHLALVYDADSGNGIWTLYINGTRQGSLENSVVPTISTPACIYLGGRPWSNNSFIGAMDSLRLTKGVLAPNQFLNAASTTPEPPPSQTVAYWKLDSDGTTLNAASQVEPRYSFIPDAYAPGGSTAEFKSFVSTPDTSESFIGDPRANAGSAAFSSNYLRIQNLGNRVELDQPFTVEGWMYWNNDTATEAQTLAGTRFDADYGWKLMLNKSGATPAFRMHCQAPGQTVMLDAAFDLNAATLVDSWHHLALTYTPRLNDNGTWELFVDGSSVGALVNSFYPTRLPQSHWFMLGGCAGAKEPFDGLLDCWRVTEGVLEPEQFLYLGYSRETLILLR